MAKAAAIAVDRSSSQLAATVAPSKKVFDSVVKSQNKKADKKLSKLGFIPSSQTGRSKYIALSQIAKKCA